MVKKSASFFAVGLLSGIVACTAIFSFIAAPNSDGGSGGRVLKLAHSLDTKHPVHLAMEHMKEQLADLSGGKLKIEIYPSGVLGSEVQCIEQLQAGSIAMTKVSTAAMETFDTQYGVFGVPYVFRDEEHFWNVLHGDIGHELLLMGEPAGMRGLCYYDAGSRNFYSTKKPIRTPEDLKGMKIRVQQSPMAIAMVKAFDASPTPIDWGELYSALAQGVVDGAENNPPSFESSRHYEVCKYFTPDAHTRVPDMLMVSSKVWQALDPQEQKWLQRAADVSSDYERELWAKKTKESLDAVAKAGVEIVECDPAAFQRACEPLKKSLASTPLGPWIARIEATK